MNEDLLSNVSVENLDKLIDALVDVVNEMKVADPELDKRFRSDAYAACMWLNSLVFEELKRRIRKQG